MMVSTSEARTKIALELTDHARASLELIKEPSCPCGTGGGPC
jgi:hypothetical protein